MRILFMGTPDIAAECLKALYAAGHEICGVYTRRDKPVGRKQVLTAPPVKEVALEHGTPVFQPRTLRDGSEDANIRALAPDLIVVVAYGCILPKSVLEAPKYGCINLHVSLLPKYRGSAPVQWAVLNGDTETGVSIMQMDEGLDTGDVLVCEKVAIGPEETSGELFDRVTAVGARVLCEAVPALEAGTLRPQPQQHENATLAPMLDKELAEFRLTDTAAHIHNWVRGMNPWPMAWFVTAGGKKVKVTECRVAASNGEARRLVTQGGVLVDGEKVSAPTASFTAEPDGDEVRMTLRAKALVHGECARCLDPVEREETVEAEWTAKERDLDDPDFELPLDEKGHLDVDEWLAQEFMFQIPTVLLCSADCPGLCPRCGKKRAECTCPPEEDKAAPVDARLAILKSLLN